MGILANTTIDLGIAAIGSNTISGLQELLHFLIF
jgi:hypothetical protein